MRRLLFTTLWNMTSTTTLVFLALFSVFALANGCTDSSTNCAAWAKSGFCSNPHYTAADRTKFCEKTCNLCSGTTTTTCKDTHASCPSYVKNGFCTNAYYSDDYKKATCADSCGLCVSTAVCASPIGGCGQGTGCPPGMTCKSNGCC